MTNRWYDEKKNSWYSILCSKFFNSIGKQNPKEKGIHFILYFSIIIHVK